MLLAAGVLLAGPVLTWAEDREAKADDKNAAKLIGTWNVTAEEKDGKKQAAASVKDRQVKITRDMITCYDKDKKVEMAGKYELDTSTKPWQITVTCTEGDNKDKKVKGIVKLNDDSLQVCYTKPGEDAPKEFKTKDGQCCVTLERAKRGTDR